MSERLPIAVLIPAWRSEEYLGEALDSVLAQTRLPSEILVVDDGSPGQAIAVICSERGATVRYLRKENGGPASARNLGVHQSCAPWLAFLDADDLWSPHKLERQWAALQASPETLLICSEASLFGHGIGDERQGELRRQGQRPDLDLASLLSANPIATSSVLLQREAFEQAGGFAENPEFIAVEDYDLWLRIAEQGPLLWITEPLISYRVHEASLSGAARFHRAVNLVLDRAVQRQSSASQQSSQARHRSAIRRHRATLDRDLAWELLEKGEVGEALRPIFHSLALTPLSWPSWKLLPKAIRAFLKRS